MRGNGSFSPVSASVNNIIMNENTRLDFTNPASAAVCFNRYTVADSLNFVRSRSRRVVCVPFRACSGDDRAVIRTAFKIDLLNLSQRF